MAPQGAALSFTGALPRRTAAMMIVGVLGAAAAGFIGCRKDAVLAGPAAAASSATGPAAPTIERTPSPSRSASVSGSSAAGPATAGPSAARPPSAPGTSRASDCPKPQCDSPAKTPFAAPPSTLKGPVARSVDTPRDRIIEQVRPWVYTCHAQAGQTGSGRVRIVLRLRPNGSVKRADVTVTGTLPRQIRPCAASRIQRAKLDMDPDSPLFLSFPVVLPAR